MTDIDLERELYVEEVLRWIPSDVSDREEIAMEIRSLIAERVAAGEVLAIVLHELGTPLKLAESYMVDEPLDSAPYSARFIAKVIDYVIPAACLAVLVLVAVRGTITGALIDASNEHSILSLPTRFWFLSGAMALMWSALLLYPALAEWHFGRTLGKAAMGLRVVQESGTQVSLGQAIVRQLAMFFQVIFFDALFIFFNPRRQRATEMLSHTRTIRAR